MNSLSCGWTALRLTALLGLSFWLQLTPAQAETAACTAQLGQQIDRVISRPELRRSRWGILIQTLDATEPQTLYAHDPDHYFTPASNVKLLTTAAALEQLGAQFRFRTSVYHISTDANGAVLQVVGSGDPSFTDEQLQNLAKQIRHQGITRISQLIGVDQFFRSSAVNPSWEWEDVQSGYGASVNRLILNQNLIGLTLIPQTQGHSLQVVWDNPTEGQDWQIVNRSRTVTVDDPEFLSVGRDLAQPILYIDGQLRVGSASEPVAISIPQPGQNFLNHFQQALVAQQIQVDRTTLSVDSEPTQPLGTEIAAVESMPLANLLTETNQESNNLYAEAILRSMGSTEASANQSSLASGIQVLESALTQLGVDPQSYQLIDGSGLSRQNLVSPRAIVQTLQQMAQSPNTATYRASLSVAGISGTLRNRFRDTPIQGHFQGKTGALSNTAALSGYFIPANDPPIVLSILVNQFDRPLGQTQQTIDEIVSLLNDQSTCFK